MINWPVQFNSIFDIINPVLPMIYGIAGLALFGLLVYGGFMWLTSTGDPEKVRKATGTIVNAVIGIAIVLFAYFATKIVGAIIGYPDLI